MMGSVTAAGRSDSYLHRPIPSNACDGLDSGKRQSCCHLIRDSCRRTHTHTNRGGGARLHCVPVEKLQSFMSVYTVIPTFLFLSTSVHHNAPPPQHFWCPRHEKDPHRWFWFMAWSAVGLNYNLQVPLRNLSSCWTFGLKKGILQ